MTGELMLYGTLIGALLVAAGIVLERFAAGARWPRRPPQTERQTRPAPQIVRPKFARVNCIVPAPQTLVQLSDAQGQTWQINLRIHRLAALLRWPRGS